MEMEYSQSNLALSTVTEGFVVIVSQTTLVYDLKVRMFTLLSNVSSLRRR